MALRQPEKENENLSVTPNSNVTAHRLLANALERAFQRKLGGVPSPTLVNQAISKLAPDGANPSPFVQHAIRVQDQLARLHAQLQSAQEPQDHAISSIQDTPFTTMPLTRAQKRFAACDDDDIPAQETKRKRLDSAGSARPRPTTPPPTSDNKADPETKAPAMSTMSLRSRSQTTDTRSDPKHAEPPRAGSVGSRQASVTDSPSGLPVMATGPPTSGPSNNNNNTMSEPNRKTPRQRSHSDDTVADGGSHGHTKSQVARPGAPAPVDPLSAQMHIKDKQLGTATAPSISTATTIPDAQGSPLPTVASPTTAAMGLPAYTRQQVESSTLTTSSFVSNIPGIWAIQVGKPSAGQIDVSFVVDHDTANSVHRWASHRQGFDPNALHVAVHLVALPTTAVSAVQHNLSQSPGGITPQAFALALRDLPPQWPEDGSLVLQLNAGQPRERTWFLSDISGGMPLDVSSAICEGTNSLCIMQLKNMADIVFAMYAASPTPEALATALEWERFRKLYSFQRPPSGWSLG